MRCDSRRRDAGEYSCVNVRKMGLPPNGLTMGKSALRKRIVVSTASSSNAASGLGSIAEFYRMTIKRAVIDCGGFVVLVAFGFGEKNFRGGDRLADVALGVVGDVNKKAPERGRQCFLADRAWLLKVRFCQSADALRSSLQS